VAAPVFSHRVDRYALDVVAKPARIVAGPLVRLACQRHLADRNLAARKQGHPRGWWFDESAADHIIEFFEDVLRLPDTLDADGEPIPFLLTPANAFIVGSLFGWRMPLERGGWRRYREAYIEMGKGNAKTPLAAGIGLYGLVMDGEQAAEIYSAATGMEQAKICWLDAQRMVNASPELAEIVHQSLNNLAYVPTMSFFRPVSNDKRGKSGPRPHMGLIDELHEAADGVIVNKLRAGAKRRTQPLFLEITNSGFDRTSICWQHHEHSRKVLEGIVEDDRWFAYVCGLDEGDDPLKDRACHIKANPNLGVVIQQDYLDRQVANAKNIPAETNTVLRLNFCVWTQAHSAFFDRGKWDACQVVSDAELSGRCYGGLDLGQADDFTAWVRIWLLKDGRVGVRCRFWVPRAALTKYPDRPYDQWERAGLLTVTEGDTTDLDLVETTVIDDCRESGVEQVAYDKRFAQQLALHLEGAGVTCVDTPQGFFLNESIRKVAAWVVTGDLGHNGHAILGWMADNVVIVTGRQGEFRIDKMRSKEKIDGIAALVMAASRDVTAVTSDQPPMGIWE
jgi:phage terminase large subunit-like protein